MSGHRSRLPSAGRRASQALLLSLSVWFLAACSSGSSRSAPTTSSSTTLAGASTTVAAGPSASVGPSNAATTAALSSVTTRTPTTTTVASSASTTIPTTFVSTPEEAAGGLFSAWRRGDRASAGHYALPSAVNRLFAQRPGSPGPEFFGCGSNRGVRTCAYRYEGGAIVMTVEGGGSIGYRVVSVEFLAD